MPLVDGLDDSRRVADSLGVKTAQMLSATDADQILGGLGGVSLLAELDAGSAGTMTGDFLGVPATGKPVAYTGITMLRHRRGLDRDRRRLHARRQAGRLAEPT